MNLHEKIILQSAKKKIKTKNDLNEIKRSVASFEKKAAPSDMKLLAAYRALVKAGKLKQNKNFEQLLATREVRTLSGVAVITVLTKPYPCPGKCIYCPADARMPKSYLPKEPAASRALALKFNPYLQVAKRIEMLRANGHETDKIELIVKGGTWSAYKKRYREWFIRRCFEGANGARFKTLESAQKKNETAKNRIVGLTLELRPDSVTPEEIAHLRRLGCTRIEMGVQTIDDKILKLVRRGHTAEEVARATRMLRDAGFKIDYHLMPALPGVSPKKDLENFKEIFENPAYRPDAIKIYPCSIIPKTALYHWWKKGKYKPIGTRALAELIIKMKLLVPRYVRIARVIRDIPGEDIAAGNTVTNLRELIRQKMQARGLECECIRCREIGRQKNKLRITNCKLRVLKYPASAGTEYFISIENKGALCAFCRLRLPHVQSLALNILPELKGAALIRELHTYGHLVPVKKRLKGASQHFGFGKKLMREAERIARKSGYKKMAVISGIGVRSYYRKLGYGLQKTYMIRSL